MKVVGTSHSKTLKTGSSRLEETQADSEKGNSIDKEVKVEKDLFSFNETLSNCLFALIKSFN